MQIGDFEIGEDGVFVIAEFGTNIFGSANTEPVLSRFCHAAKDAGADAVKVQLYKHDLFPIREWDMKSQMEFPRDLFPGFCELAKGLGLVVGASVFDEEAVELCAEHADYIKLATREADNFDLLKLSRSTGLPIIRSVDWRRTKFSDREDDDVVLGCVPIYPTPPRREYLPLSLNYILRRPAGWSSHSQGYADVVCAVEEGAVVIEKHFCMHPSDYESRWSLMPRDFAEMVWNIRAVEEF